MKLLPAITGLILVLLIAFGSYVRSVPPAPKAKIDLSKANFNIEDLQQSFPLPGDVDDKVEKPQAEQVEPVESQGEAQAAAAETIEL